MNTTVEIQNQRTHQVVQKTNTTSSFWSSIEFNRFGIIPILLTLIGCAGGIAAGFGAKNDIFRLALIAFPTAIVLALILAVSPMRTITRASIIALVLDLIILIF